ncbi:MAG: hypothetical protein F6K58_25940 [Symploca sp. SIO2E9]|nr:hypothetical protein [Symploca sp. SIO2E9]
MNSTSDHKILETLSTASNLRRLEVCLEYCELAVRPTLSLSETDRVAEILELAQSDNTLSEILDEADLFISRRFSLQSAKALSNYGNQIAKLSEYLEVFLAKESPQTSSALHNQFELFRGSFQ